MSFFKKLFGKKNEVSSDSLSEHLVRLHIPLSNESFGDTEEFDRWLELEDVLDTVATRAKVGSLDGNEIGGGEYTIWLYGANGARLAEVVKTEALKFGVPAGSTLFVRHGGVEDRNAREETIPVS